MNTAPTELMRNPGHNRFKLHFLRLWITGNHVVLAVFRILVPIDNVLIFFDLHRRRKRNVEFIRIRCNRLFRFQNFSGQLHFRSGNVGKRHLKHLQKPHLRFKIRLSPNENFNRLFHVMCTIFFGFDFFRVGQRSVNIKRNRRFPNAISHETFKRFQPSVDVGHNIIIVKRKLPKNV